MATAQEILRRMEALQAARARAIEPLAEILEERDELQRKLAALDEPYGKAFAEAEAAGWSADELHAIGAEEPTRRPKGRPRKRFGAKRPAETAPTAAPETGGPTAAVPAQQSTGNAVTAAAG
ncbi:hypothetical protein OG851_42525 (plasmid) [Streptomyces sp. NBC_00161]|uniref:hypothetical protein n=1 Tax=Streptomyces sp. NBC_00161 TaxID=2975671 RepID=UPI002F90DF59